MHSSLAIEVQKAVIEERLRSAALAQRHHVAPDQPKRRVATGVRRRIAARVYAPWSVRSA
jgi:hypothetical protein